ncbi:hypothetical protein [Alteromonas oceanisediminis]|uniref:hypothetical protein n=1 Tax=Alteromonas oceanisediminis TaxID=2836180 RepID=UPI001BD9AD1C|nr:hypothetical protein [Alteromonas oceanisediminis]MBT0585085.1 hypothetical protein [Alteromonas oceanisediminis]
MSTSDNTPQSDIFVQISEQRLFADVCNALYERELMNLATQGPGQAALMKRRLGGLSHHVKRAAEYLVANPTPLSVDAHNGSWQGKQASRSPATAITDEQTHRWFTDNVSVGLPVCVSVKSLDHEHLELDCVDRIDSGNHRLHLNRFGWFSFTGHPLNDESDSEPVVLRSSQHNPLDKVIHRLVKPCKKTMLAACAGHCWNHKGRLSPRTLTLRELLLSTLIDWKTFTYTGKPQFV